MNKTKIMIATRESPLALIQSEWVKEQLLLHHPNLVISFLGIRTLADKRLDVSLTKIGGKGLFVKELEEALYEGRADIAVHSMKDVPMELPKGLTLPVVCERHDPRDVLVSNDFSSLNALPQKAIVGTSSLRRQLQLQAIRSDLQLKNLRGNIETRLTSLDEGHFDAIILAAAGLKRLRLATKIKQSLSIETFLPAAGQGALGIECREEASEIQALIQPLNDPITSLCVNAERALCREIGAGCTAPVAAYAEIHGNQLTLKGLVANRDGSRFIRVREEGKAKEALEIGSKAAQALIAQGALQVLKEFEQ